MDNKYVVGIKTKDLNFCSLANLAILLNIPSELFALLNLRRYDKNVKMFNNNLDFIQDKHELVNRKFHIVHQ